MSESSFRIYMVEDDPWYGQLLVHHLSLNPEWHVELFTTGKALMDALSTPPDLVCMDFGLPDFGGEKLLRTLLDRLPGLPVVVISGQEDISVAVNLLKMGARDYLVKDNHTRDLLWRSVVNIRENASLRREVEQLREQLEGRYTFENSIIGQSEAVRRTFRLVQKAIQSTINVSLRGETGTGKEVYAKAIHYNSDRRKKPFVAVNVGAIPHELAESELFGHESGAFTGAKGQRKGKFEEANGGTLFLDEIGEMDLALQTKLLRVLQEREVVRVGGNARIPVNIRLISATHKDLSEEVRKGTFREDLYFRIMGLPIELPPLRERDNDVLILAKHFVDEYAREHKVSAPVLSPDARLKLKLHTFPGNVRELKAVIDLACVMSNGTEIVADDITFYQRNADAFFPTGEKTLRAFTIDIIQHYLRKYNFNVVQVAERLDIGKSTIYNMVKSGELSLDK